MAILNINVTQLQQACLDVEWRKGWLKDTSLPIPWFGQAKGQIPVMGQLFHRIVDKYITWLVSGDPAESLSLNDDTAHWEKMWDRFVGNEVEKLLKEGKGPSALHVKDCLREFCRRLDHLRHSLPGFQIWSDLYLVKEFSVKKISYQCAGHRIFISGQIDAVRAGSDGGLEIVDYKLSKGEKLQHDLLQVAIYAYLLNKQKVETDFTGILEYYHPAFEMVSISFLEMQTIFSEMVEPVLRELCEKSLFDSHKDPQKAADAKDGKGKQKVRGKEVKKIKTPIRDYSQAIEKCYAEFKLGVTVEGFREAPQLVRYHVKPQAGIKVVSLANRSDDLQVQLGLNQPPMINATKGSVTIDLVKEKPDTVFWRDVVNDTDYQNRKGRVSFPIGIGVDNRVIMADLADPNTCHVLVAGGTGSGKSEFLKSMVASLVQFQTPSFIKLSIVDPKFLTFSPLKKSSFLYGPLIHEVEDAIHCLDHAVNDMNARYQRLADEGFENLASRIDAGKNDIPFYIIMFDEFADLVIGNKDNKKEFEELVARLAAKGRAAGIHLVLATQRPDAKVVTGLIKANLPLKICLKVNNASNSQIVLDQPGGERLLGRGDLLCDRGRGVERAQGPYIPPDQLYSVTK